MTSTICLDEKYSTTRMLTKKKPGSISIPNRKFESYLSLPKRDGRQGEGGLRTKGYYKTCLDDKPLITVITVVFNGEGYLEETINSVINQTYQNVEYIIIDGGSTDGTIDIIKKYEDKLDYWVSESDEGIYYAMNKGLVAATGEWINFMNAGDKFINNNLIAEIYFELLSGRANLLYGNVSSGNNRLNKREIKNKIQFTYMTICHQAIFADRSCFCALFDTTYKFLADYKWLLNCYTNSNIRKRYIDKEICYFATQRLKKEKYLERLKESYQIGNNHFNLINRAIFNVNQLRLYIKFNFFWKV